tara:strand:- start:543 stop:773 length:231 start_codon:yes stop_codon:yes gene_type:complete
MKKYTQKEFNKFEIVDGYRQCPQGDYSLINKFGDNNAFYDFNEFGDSNEFGDFNEFGIDNRFGDCNEFGDGNNPYA